MPIGSLGNDLQVVFLLHGSTEAVAYNGVIISQNDSNTHVGYPLPAGQLKELEY